ncbi:hypothetical protein [Actinomadura sp. 21ATH]|uniref:hypothetical protein n=1 Tax=Actinomadura sp. 21ATH TaxID=1735444 RepID=UPI0035C0D739
MKCASVMVAILAGVGAGLIQRLLSRSRRTNAEAGRWLVVTVACPPERLAQSPGPLARLGAGVETRIEAAPGGRGTELAARVREPGPSGFAARLAGRDPRQEVRAALRNSKSLLETGEVLRPDSPPTTRPTLRGKVMEAATRRAGGEGRL